MKKGLDISKHQRGLRMQDVKSAGYDFVILRGAYSGYGADRTKHKDNCFDDFYRQAKNLGIKVGAYFYSCAKTRDEGIAEAKFFYENALKGNQFEMPVYIDVEDEHWQSNDKKGVTDAIIGFCSYLEALGFYVGIYASLYWFNAKIETERLTGYTKWVAKWTSGANEKPVVGFNAFDMWQYTSHGIVAGTRVDEDICYIDFETIIKKVGKNGYEPTLTSSVPKPEPTPQPIQEPKEEKHEQIYVVKKGDTLSKIAKKYKTTVKALVEKNGIKDKNKIYIGQVIKL